MAALGDKVRPSVHVTLCLSCQAAVALAKGLSVCTTCSHLCVCLTLLVTCLSDLFVYLAYLSICPARTCQAWLSFKPWTCCK
jgi:hypothetical protein